MKILHTSDWHIGNRIHGFDRYDQHADMLSQICHIAEEEQPDLFLLCGDVFDTWRPSPDSRRLFNDTILRLRHIAPKMTIIVIAGNHDSGKTLEIDRNLWLELGVNVVGMTRNNPDDFHEYLVETPDCVVAAIPFFSSRTVGAGYMSDIVKATHEKADGRNVIVMAHTTVAGCDIAGHEDTASDGYIGGVEALAPDAFGHGFAYCALGHIHRPQTIRSSGEVIRYCGSPIAVSFDEQYPHCVDIISVENNSVISIRHREIIPLHPLVTLPKDSFIPLDDALAMLDNLDSSIDPFIRLNVEVEDILAPDAFERAGKIVENKKCTLCHINTRRKQRIRKSDGFMAMSIDEFRKENPLDIAERYAADTGREFSAEMREMMTQILQSLNFSE